MTTTAGRIEEGCRTWSERDGSQGVSRNVPPSQSRGKAFWFTAFFMALSAVLLLSLFVIAPATNTTTDIVAMDAQQEQEHRRLPGDAGRFVSSVFETPPARWTLGQWILALLLVSLLFSLCGGGCCYRGHYRRGGGGAGFCGCLRDILLCLCCYELFCHPGGPGPDLNECCGPAYNSMIV